AGSPGAPASAAPHFDVGKSHQFRPGLWMGGHLGTDRAGEVRPAVAGGEFDLVISLFTARATDHTQRSST
ncbi:hypothetical protein ACFWB8_31185, partial [Streptomyces sp. NPDC060031]